MYIIDLDGTLLNVWIRYYSVFNDFWKIPNLTLEEYKNLKKKYEFDDLIVNKLAGKLDEDKFQEYKLFKKKYLEDFQYLKLDKLIPKKLLLKRFILKNEVLILTIRNNINNLFKQIDFLDINFLRNKLVVLENNGPLTKKVWVEKNIEKSVSKIVIGDSETDLAIGELKNTKVYLVESGLRDPLKILDKILIKGDIIPDINYILINQ